MNLSLNTFLNSINNFDKPKTGIGFKSLKKNNRKITYDLKLYYEFK